MKNFKTDYKPGDRVIVIRESNMNFNGHNLPDNFYNRKIGEIINVSSVKEGGNTLSGFWLFSVDGKCICPSMVKPYKLSFYKKLRISYLQLKLEWNKSLLETTKRIKEEDASLDYTSKGFAEELERGHLQSIRKIEANIYKLDLRLKGLLGEDSK